MRQTLWLIAFGVLGIGMVIAQDTPTSTASGARDQSPQAKNASPGSQSAIRGCLTGSSGNYTLTDQNGTQYQVAGDDATLRSMVGREVEITGLANQASETQGDAAISHAPNGVQASDVRAISSVCAKVGSANHDGDKH
jgi:hypothetical protein